jgi:hypothetical protein
MVWVIYSIEKDLAKHQSLKMRENIKLGDNEKKMGEKWAK